jgi:hypothetical protein
MNNGPNVQKPTTGTHKRIFVGRQAVLRPVRNPDAELDRWRRRLVDAVREANCS